MTMIERLRSALPLVLSLLGLVLLIGAAWAVAAPLGLAVAGIACFVAEWRITT